MTPIEQAAQVLRELIALQAIKDKYAHARPDSPRHPQWKQYLADVEGFFERQIVSWESARAALASLEAAKQEPQDWTKDAREYGNALNDAAWVFIETCPEKSTLLFNHCKPALRDAILKYSESLAAAPSQKP